MLLDFPLDLDLDLVLDFVDLRLEEPEELEDEDEAKSYESDSLAKFTLMFTLEGRSKDLMNLT